MIQISNGVTNILGTPSMISDTLANRPDGKDVAVGTIFIDISTGDMFQSDGISWYAIGGGGIGTIYGIDDVLAQNQYLTATREINIDGNQLNIVEGVDNLISVLSTNVQLNLRNDSFAQLRLNSSGSSRKIDTAFQTASGVNLTGLQIEGNDSDNGIYVNVGDYANTFNGTKLIIDDNLRQVKVTNFAGQISGILLDIDSDQFRFGNEQYFFYADSNGSVLQSFTGANKYGFNITDKVTTLGDYNSTGGYCELDNDNSVFSIKDFSIINIGNTTTALSISTNGISLNGAITIGGIHTNTGQHLKVNINGTNYTINLQTP